MGGLRVMATEMKLDRVWQETEPYWALTLLHTEALVDNVRSSCAEDPTDLHLSQDGKGRVSLQVSYRLTRRAHIDAVLRPSSTVVQVEYRTKKTLLSLRVRSLIEAGNYIRWSLRLPAPLVALLFWVFSR